MKLNVTFDYAKVYDFKSLDVATGEKFRVEALDLEEGAQWFFNNDSVLDVFPTENEALITAKSEGISRILFVKDSRVISGFDITVVNPISLNPVVSSIELK